MVGSPVGFHNSANHVQVQQSGLQMVRMDPGLPGIAFDSRTPSQARVALNISYHFANIYSVLQAAGWITECLGPNHAYVRGPPDNREGHQDSRTRAYTNLQYPVYNYICMSARCHQNDSDMVFGCCIVSLRSAWPQRGDLGQSLQYGQGGAHTHGYRNAVVRTSHFKSVQA